jgi:hypothetical protein
MAVQKDSPVAYPQRKRSSRADRGAITTVEQSAATKHIDKQFVAERRVSKVAAQNACAQQVNSAKKQP